uniref:Uncharacterized protein n=1 Tax=Ditylenchus dipsaci TaxID=166011 RepID=A0A915EN34_9BILA
MSARILSRANFVVLPGKLAIQTSDSHWQTGTCCQCQFSCQVPVPVLEILTGVHNNLVLIGFYVVSIFITDVSSLRFVSKVKLWLFIQCLDQGKDDKSKQIEVSIAMEDGDLLGVTTDDRMRITNIQAPLSEMDLAGLVISCLKNKSHYQSTKCEKVQDNEDSAKTCIPIPISDVTIPVTDGANKQAAEISVLPEVKSSEQPKSEDTKTCIVLLTESALTIPQAQRIENLEVKTGKCGPLPAIKSTKLAHLSDRCKILEDRNAHLKHLKVLKGKETKAEPEKIDKSSKCPQNIADQEVEKEDKTSDGDKILAKKLDDKTPINDNVDASRKK